MYTILQRFRQKSMPKNRLESGRCVLALVLRCLVTAHTLRVILVAVGLRLAQTLDGIRREFLRHLAALREVGSLRLFDFAVVRPNPYLV